MIETDIWYYYYYYYYGQYAVGKEKSGSNREMKQEMATLELGMQDSQGWGMCREVLWIISINGNDADKTGFGSNESTYPPPRYHHYLL